MVPKAYLLKQLAWLDLSLIIVRLSTFVLYCLSKINDDDDDIEKEI